MKDGATYKFLASLRGGSTNFGPILEAVRNAEGLTQDEFGLRTQISRSRICDYEKGRRLVTPQVAAHIANTFGYDPARFIAFVLEEALDKDGLAYAVVVARRRAINRANP